MVKPFPISETPDKAKNFFIGWCEMAVKNGTLTEKVWNEGIVESFRFAGLIDLQEKKLLKEMDDKRKNPVTYVQSHNQRAKEMLRNSINDAIGDFVKEGRE